MRPQLDRIGPLLESMKCHAHAIGRLRSPSSAANLSTSTKLESAVSVKFRASTKPTRSFTRRVRAGCGSATVRVCRLMLITMSPAIKCPSRCRCTRRCRIYTIRTSATSATFRRPTSILIHGVEVMGACVISRSRAFVGAFEVKRLFHGILHFLHSSFFVRLGIPFLRPDPHVLQSRRAQELSRSAVAPPVRRLRPCQATP